MMSSENSQEGGQVIAMFSSTLLSSVGKFKLELWSRLNLFFFQ